MNINETAAELQRTAQLYFRMNADGTPLIPQNRQRPLALMGAPGIGKTELGRQAAAALGCGYLQYDLTHHTRQSAGGLPVIEQEVLAGQTVSLTQYTMSEILAEVWRTGEKNGILQLDEFNCVSDTLHPLLLQFLQSKQFGRWALPVGWMILLTGNPTEYNRSARAFDPVLRDRVRCINVETDLPDWLTYLRAEQRLHPAVDAYFANRKNARDLLCTDGNGTVTPRAWAELCEMLTLYEEEKAPVTTEFFAEYLPEQEVALRFYAFYETFTQVISPLELDKLLQSRRGWSSLAKRLMQRPEPLRAGAIAALRSRVLERAAACHDRTRRMQAVGEVLTEWSQGAKRDGAFASVRLAEHGYNLPDGSHMSAGDLAPDRAVLEQFAVQLPHWPLEAGLACCADYAKQQNELHLADCREASETLRRAAEFVKTAFGDTGVEYRLFCSGLTEKPEIAQLLGECGGAELLLGACTDLPGLTALASKGDPHD